MSPVLTRSAVARSLPTDASPAPGVGPEIPVARGSPPNCRAAAKSVSSSWALGAARTGAVVDGAELGVRRAADRRIEGVADYERAGHDRRPEQRSEDHESRLARTANDIAQ